MINSIVKYLVEASIYLGFFLLIYKWFISSLTHFVGMRFFLLSSLLLSVILPLIALPGQWSMSLFGDLKVISPISLPVLKPEVFTGQSSTGIDFGSHQSFNILNVVIYLVIAVYMAGALFKLAKLGKSLLRIRHNVRTGSRYRDGRYWFINLQNQAPAASFFNLIFINSDDNRLSQNDLIIIREHERVHARQYHSVDTLLVELYSVVFWFNPTVKYLKNRIAEVHEFLADARMCTGSASKKEYSNLLLGLTCEIKECGLTSGFSGKQICRRVQMLAKSRSAGYTRFAFLMVLPVALILLLSFSWLNTGGSVYSQTSINQQSALSAGKMVGKVTWTGNVSYSEKQLNRALKLKKGDPYSKEIKENRLFLADDGVSSLYLDNGYVFFNVVPAETENPDGSVDLCLTIYEGTLSKIGKILIVGNGDVPVQEVIDRIKFKQGDLFSRKAIISSIRSIAGMNKFNPEKIMPVPIPNGMDSSGKFAIIDIEFQVVKK